MRYWRIDLDWFRFRRIRASLLKKIVNWGKIVSYLIENEGYNDENHLAFELKAKCYKKEKYVAMPEEEIKKLPYEEVYENSIGE